MTGASAVSSAVAQQLSSHMPPAYLQHQAPLYTQQPAQSLEPAHEARQSLTHGGFSAAAFQQPPAGIPGSTYAWLGGLAQLQPCVPYSNTYTQVPGWCWQQPTAAFNAEMQQLPYDPALNAAAFGMYGMQQPPQAPIQAATGSSGPSHLQCTSQMQPYMQLPSQPGIMAAFHDGSWQQPGAGQPMWHAGPARVQQHHFGLSSVSGVEATRQQLAPSHAAPQQQPQQVAPSQGEPTDMQQRPDGDTIATHQYCLC